jgi:CubicO group peptidase (beta-lactamase class C family)
MAGIEDIWRVQDEQVAAARIPGYVAAVRIRGEVHVHAGGHRGLEPGAPPMTEDTVLRIASLSKPIGAALALGLVEAGVLSLDDEIGRWLPEAADPRVLAHPDAALEDTVPAVRPILVRHLLDFTAGWGVVFDGTPLMHAMLEAQVFPGAIPQPLAADELLARVCALPLRYQPGEGWLYDTPMDLLGVLLARCTGTPLGDLLRERVLAPLGMEDTGFSAPASRLATAYQADQDGVLQVADPADGVFSRTPSFEKLGGGLVSTAGDLLRFFGALADGGAPVLTEAGVAAMTTPALSPAQRELAGFILGPGASWGLGTSVDVEAAEPWMAPGRWGWNGGIGTTAYVDPSRDTIGVLLTQRMMAGPLDGFGAFWSAVAAA